ncbi:MAG: cytochrome P460 family protein, partial [Candidatus Thiodiazotropha sp.]
AVIIFDLLDTMRTDNAVTESRRKVLGVMHKDSTKFTATGGWGFEGFGGGDPTNRVVGNKAASACFACHQPQKGQDYTFSQLRD